MHDNNLYIPNTTLNISRELMPQIEKDVMNFIKKDFQTLGINVVEKNIDPEKLKPIQGEFNTDKIISLMKTNALREPIIISNDYYVVDGNHRWVAHLNKSKNKEIKAIMIDLPVLEIINKIRSLNITKSKNITENIRTIIREKNKLFF